MKARFAFFIAVIPLAVFCQDENEKKLKKKTKFSGGLYLGSYFANKHTASLYDGYGYDAEGNKNNFGESFLYNKIVMELGGGWGQTDQIAQALGVNPGEWSFDQTDMPMEMKYSPAISVGMQIAYAAGKRDALILDVQATRLNAHGNFTIVITTPPIGPQPPGYQNIQTFGITGGEQRLTFRAGYRRLLGEDETVNAFVELGPVINSTEYLRNRAVVNNLHADLSLFYSQQYYPTYRARYLRGWGAGAFAGLGVQVKANESWTLHLLYSASYEKINIGEAPALKLQNTAGVRALYNL